MNRIIHPVAFASIISLMAIGAAHARAPNAVVFESASSDPIMLVVQTEELQALDLYACEEPDVLPPFPADFVNARVTHSHTASASIVSSRPDDSRPSMVAVVPLAVLSGDCRVEVISGAAKALDFNSRSGQLRTREGPVAPFYDGAYRNGPV